jgi:4,5-DOPA dioxygenase extradiol
MTSAAAVFISHGSPMVAIEEDGYTRALRFFGENLILPRGIVVVSAHWEAPTPIRVTATEKPSLVYDFGGFPEALYHLQYPCPGSRELAEEIVGLLERGGLAAAADANRGLDHGVWVPLRRTFPAAEVPVVEVSLPQPRTVPGLLRMGRALAPLRERGVMLLGSGGVVHNLRRVRFDYKTAPVDTWALEFDAWVAERVRDRDTEGLAAYRSRAPNSELAVPTTEHFDPIFFTMGAALPGDRLVPIFEGFHHGNLSMRSFSLS